VKNSQKCEASDEMKKLLEEFADVVHVEYRVLSSKRKSVHEINLVLSASLLNQVVHRINLVKSGELNIPVVELL
jgi:hypothetical protein